MFDNRNIYRSKEFAIEWDKYLKENPDYPRLMLSNPIIEKYLGDLAGKIILDAGCGNGFFLPNLIKKNPKKIFAVDISPFLIKFAKTSNNFPQISYQVCDLMEKMPFEKNFFDAILSYNVMSEMPEISVVFREMHRTLKKGGKAIVCILHPLYHLWVNDVKANSEGTLTRLKRYPKSEPLLISTIDYFKDFIVYRHPVENYVQNASNAGFKIKKIFPITISKEIGKKKEKYAERNGLPVFLFMVLEK